MRKTETEYWKAGGNEKKCKRYNRITRKEVIEENQQNYIR